jgi:predicted DCC family thiol-disulfide oxidoreductase YuxK
MEKKLTVVFDDGCPMCTVGMNVADSLDGKDAVEFVGMNTERGKTLVQEHKLDMNASAYAFRADGTRTEKSQMMRDVLANNGVLGFIMSLPFRIPYLNDILYRILAWTRWHITKSKTE